MPLEDGDYGWRLVPERITTEMSQAWDNAIPASAQRNSDGSLTAPPLVWRDARWAALLAAAPKGAAALPVKLIPPLLQRAIRTLYAFAAEGLEVAGAEDPADIVLEFMDAQGTEDFDEAVASPLKPATIADPPDLNDLEAGHDLVLEMYQKRYLEGAMQAARALEAVLVASDYGWPRTPRTPEQRLADAARRLSDAIDEPVQDEMDVMVAVPARLIRDLRKAIPQ
ncbi:MAG: hypothetical protein E7K72_19340 [Roseomonas mucosa]|nr:hypothetical protein [Roseomonas mucosa]